MRSKLIISIFVGTTLISLPHPTEAGPYEDLMAKLEFCRDLETKETRLNCFEALVPEGEINFSLTPSLILDPALAPKKREPEIKITPKKMAPPEPQVTKPNETKAEDKFGAEHIPETADEKADKGESSSFTYKVERTGENRNKLVFFYMENGQVWRQMERQRILVPKGREFDVIITQGSFGDYKLKIEGKGRQTRVKRVK